MSCMCFYCGGMGIGAVLNEYGRFIYIQESSMLFKGVIRWALCRVHYCDGMEIGAVLNKCARFLHVSKQYVVQSASSLRALL